MRMLVEKTNRQCRNNLQKVRFVILKTNFSVAEQFLINVGDAPLRRSGTSDNSISFFCEFNLFFLTFYNAP